MSRRTAILVALGSLVLLTWVTVVSSAATIERDLAERTIRNLAAYAITGLDVRVDGRDVYLSGELSPKIETTYVGEVAGETWGVRMVNTDGLRQRASLLDPNDPLNPRFQPEGIAQLGGDLSNPLDAPTCQRMMARIAADSSVRFEVGGASPMPESYPVLNDLAAVAFQCPDTRLIIGAHTESGPEREFKLRLSEARAGAVERFFHLAGIPTERMQIIAYGDSQPVASNSSAQGRAANRRITFDVLPLE